MKKKKFIIAVLTAFLFSVLLFAGCENGWGLGFEDGEKDKPSDTVYVIQYFDGAETKKLEVKNGDVYSLKTLPQKTGYEFLGLYDAEEGGVQYVNAVGMGLQPFSENRNLVLYPRFQAKEFTFLLDYGAAPALAVTSVKTFYGAAVNGLPLGVEAEHKEFKGWYTAPDCGGNRITDSSNVIFGCDKVTEEVFDLSDKDGYIRLYAGFEDVYYPVKFYYGNTLLHEEELLGGSALLEKAPKETGDGGVILKWSYNRNGSAIASDAKVEGAYNVYALSVGYKISFDSAGGSELATQDGIAGERITLPEPVKEHYEFLGWEQNGEAVSMEYRMPNANVKLTATWRKVDFIVTYLEYDGGEAVQTQAVRVGGNVPLPKIEREHYEFSFWAFGDERVEDQFPMPEEDITLVAQWKQVEFTVTYRDKDSSRVYGTVYFKAGTEVSFLDLQKTHYEHIGWEYENEPLTETLLMPEKDIIVYARWKQVEFRIIYDCAGGTAISDTVVRCGRTVPLPRPVREYYDFLGWNYGGKTITSLTMPENDVRLTAQWTQTYGGYTYIRTAGDFMKIKENPNGKYMLLNNLDLSGAGWTAMGQFYGTLNGMGHTVELSDRPHTFSIQATDTMYLGWFCGVNAGTLTDFSVKDLVFRSTQNYHLGTYTVYMGGIVGYNTDSGKISNVKLVNTTSGDASAANAQIICDRNNSACGGIAGVNHGTISGCSVSARIYCTGDTGGIAGQNGGTVSNCSFTGKIGFYMTFNNGKVHNRSWGGIVGYCNANAKITSCTVTNATFEYWGEESKLHKTNLFGTHDHCNLQPHVGIICGSAANEQSFSGNSHSGTSQSLQLKGGNFHNGDHEKTHMFKRLSGMLGAIVS